MQWTIRYLGEVRKMDAIRRYVEGLFEKTPKNLETNQFKREIIGDMEDRYQIHLENGLNEDEALGRVISEYGNLDEIIDEIRVKNDKRPEKTDEEIEIMEELYKPDNAEVFDYLTVCKQVGSGVGIGVFLILIGVSIYMMLLGFLGEDSGIVHVIGISTILAAVAASVGIFIYNGMKTSKYGRFEEVFIIDEKLKQDIRRMKENYRKSYTLSIIIGVALSIISVIPIIIIGILFPNSQSSIFFAVSSLLLMIGAATFLFVYSGNIWTSYNTILRNGRHASEMTDYRKLQRENKIRSVIENYYWPIIVIIYLFWSFTTASWAYSWIIFVVAGILEDFILRMFDADHYDEDY